MGVEIAQHSIGKVQACRGCSHASLYLAVHRLVGSLIAFLGLTVEIRRNRQLAHGLKYLGKAHLRGIPIEVNPVVSAAGARLGRAPLRLVGGHITPHGGREGKLIVLYLELPRSEEHTSELQSRQYLV